MNDLLNYIHKIAPEIIIIGSLTIIQIVPIKINPWSWLAGWIKKAIGIGELNTKINDLDNKIENLEVKFDEQIKHIDKSNARTRSKVIRKEIITFAEELKRGCDFSLAEFEEIGRLINEYRKLIKEHKFKNAYCVAQMEYIEEAMKTRTTKEGEEHEEIFVEQ